MPAVETEATDEQNEVLSPDNSVEEKKARVAVFDFDGTCIDSSSSMLLVRYLKNTRKLSPLAVIRLVMWGASYKLRLSARWGWACGQVFAAFEGKPADEVNQFLTSFYDEYIDSHFRAAADAAMRAHEQAGDTVLMISATFEPFIKRAMDFHPITGQVSTRMQVSEDGRYTREIDGRAIEGEQKPGAITRWCDERFGPGKWELASAYGDHYSDRFMLEMAEQPFAVSPDHSLARLAADKGWAVLDW